MPDKDITPGMHVLITGNHYNDGDLTIAEDELEHDELLTGIVIEPADYDEEWGQKWMVQVGGKVGEGPPPNIVLDQDLSPIPKINMDPTERGFEQGEFTDLYRSTCSIQESSLATEGAIWFGVNDDGHFNMKTPPEKWDESVYGKQSTGGRMHLSQGQAAALLPLLKYFVEHGQLPRELPDS